MSDGRRELAYHGQSRATRQRLPCVMPGNLRSLALRDVLDDGGDVGEGASRIKDPRNADSHPDHLTTLTEIPFFRRVVLAPAAPHILDHLLRGLAVLFMRDVQRAERLQFLAGVADHFLKRLVRGHEMLLLIDDGDADRRCFEHAAPTLLARTECCFGTPPPKDFVLKLRGAGGDAPLELRICLTQRRFSAL